MAFLIIVWLYCLNNPTKLIGHPQIIVHTANPRPNWRGNLIFLLPCLVVGVLVRVYFFSGVSLADDVNYWTQAIATGLNGDWPPLKQHWHVRIGLVLPCALLLKIFGLKLWVPYIFTMLGGLAEIGLTYHIARQFTSESTARLATWLCVFFPLNILYSTYLYVDVWAGVLGAASIYFWHRGMVTDRIRYYTLASTFFGLAWLFRETILMCGPIFIVLWLYSRRWHSPKFLWILPPALLILTGEALLYQLTAGNWHYRMDAILASRGQLVADFSTVKSFWVEPLVELLTSHELGIFMLAALVISIQNFSRFSKPLALWLLTGFAWLCWGTTVPVAWLPLQGDPRYLTVLTIPCVVLLAVFITNLRLRLWRIAITSGLIITGLVSAAMDLGSVKLTAHQRFTFSPYNQTTTALEPFVYFGARAVQKFRTNAVHYACSTDLGRITAMKQIVYLPATRTMDSAQARYLVLSVENQPEKWKKKEKEGWRVVAVIRGDGNRIRNLAVKLLIYAGQPTRLEPIVRSPALVVLENPTWPPENPTSL